MAIVAFELMTTLISAAERCGLIEAPFTRRSEIPRLSRFPQQDAAASLKLDVTEGDLADVLRFPQQNTAASLKHCAV